ncbi:isocitrate lyase/phosphoenolpyruvate mutase family protein [Planctomonas sp. JC2975]|uniref:isocitrate lyase/PEP mutase family protein n=1 Tax=Planctomonas sp. JC2975 TaxID=2729626 RepID=UPI001473D569|nr:isocitrate lyase/phosphoenolpyruvate mutase family protein [Planctomonas sp. JC2975]NNC10745.1 isocitrate lyase/phosphoenolpyruvate mutase family protein [Planctomonas sp. JC2975]
MTAEPSDARPGFAELHRGPLPLLLPNAWDVSSALAFTEAGFPAVGTTSFGVNAAHGTPDAGGASRETTRDLVHALRVLPVHVTADVEDGFSDDAGEVAAYVAELGVAGVNLEDSQSGRLVDPGVVAGKIRAIKAAAPGVFVNARVDTYWFGIDATPERTLERAKVYVEAGADGVFVPGRTGAPDAGGLPPEALEKLAAGVPVPLNVLVTALLTLSELGELGVRRVSTGSLPYRAAIDAAVAVATTIRDGGVAPAATGYAQAQQRLEEYAARSR